MVPTITTLQADGVSVWRNDNLVIDRISFTVSAGGALLIQGANGSGKTTLLRVLAGLRYVDDGRIYVDDGDIDALGTDYRSRVSFLGHRDGLHDALSAVENLTFAARLRGLDPGEFRPRIDQVRLTLDIDDFADIAVRSLSAGQRRRVALARLAVEKRELWLLDEPFTAIDASGREQIERMICAHLDQRGLCIFTSHQPMAQRALAALTATLSLERNASGNSRAST